MTSLSMPRSSNAPGDPNSIRGSHQTVVEPKNASGFRAVIEIPADITELYYDAKFPYRPLVAARV